MHDIELIKQHNQQLVERVKAYSPGLSELTIDVQKASG